MLRRFPWTYCAVIARTMEPVRFERPRVDVSYNSNYVFLVPFLCRELSTVTPGYMSGFGNSFETEALQGALPVGRNSPQKVNYGLYAEQLSGSPFTAPQSSNQRSWLYRVRPTVRHARRFHRVDKGHLRTAPAREGADLRCSPSSMAKSSEKRLAAMT